MTKLFTVKVSDVADLLSKGTLQNFLKIPEFKAF